MLPSLLVVIASSFIVLYWEFGRAVPAGAFVASSRLVGKIDRSSTVYEVDTPIHGLRQMGGFPCAVWCETQARLMAS